MNKIITIGQAIKLGKKIKAAKKSIVVAGGVFDILHVGHVKFLENAKQYGDYLFILLEEDINVRKEKGKNRPINSQKNRAKVLSSIRSVDYVILLKNMKNNMQYDKIMLELKPDIIATTYGDPYVDHKKRQAQLINGKVAYVIKRIHNQSTSKYIDLIN